MRWLWRSTDGPPGNAQAWVPRMLDALKPWCASPIGGESPEAQPVRRGGRAAALAALQDIDPAAYARTRNRLDGAITRLSPWLRHGVLSTAEVRDVACRRVPRPELAEKLVSELAWRDYWQRVYASLGERIETPLEPAAATSRHAIVNEVPHEVLTASTGMACIDAFVRQLHETGFLHNHARMWLASWLVHARGVRWQAGAAWFLSRLLDADPASNTLSWQWVAGTFSAKPYIFNRENLERFTDGRFCSDCRLAGRCDLEGSYDALASAWFCDEPRQRPKLTIPPTPTWQPPMAARAAGGHPLVWLTLDSLSEASPAAQAHPTAPRVCLIDPAWLARERPSRLRLQFILECLADVERLDLALADPVAGLTEAVAGHAATGVAVAETPCPFVRQAAEIFAATHPLQVVTGPPLVDHRRISDLGRFSRYWSKVQRSALTPGGPAG